MSRFLSTTESGTRSTKQCAEHQAIRLRKDVDEKSPHRIQFRFCVPPPCCGETWRGKSSRGGAGVVWMPPCRSLNWRFIFCAVATAFLMLTSTQKVDAGRGWYCYVHAVALSGIFFWLLSRMEFSCLRNPCWWTLEGGWVGMFMPP